MKRFLKGAVLVLAIYVMSAQVFGIASGVKGHASNPQKEIAGGIDIIYPEPIFTIKLEA